MILCLATPGTVRAQSGAAPSPDTEAVTRAARDYLEGFYEGDSAKIVRSVSPTVVKYGYYVPKGDSTYHGESMTFAEMLDYVRKVKARGRAVPATRAQRSLAVRGPGPDGGREGGGVVGYRLPASGQDRRAVDDHPGDLADSAKVLKTQRPSSV